MNERHRKKRLDAVRYVLALPKSIWYNFRLLPIHQACRLPLLVSHRTRIVNLSGKMELNADRLKVGLVKIGFGTYQGTNFHNDRTRLNLRGRLIVNGACIIGAGSSIEVTENGILEFANHFNMGPKSLIICNKNFSFGEKVQTSWNCTFMDTDQHELIDSVGNRSNNDRPILIGDNVWIGCHVIIIKGTRLASNITIGAGSIVHGVHDETCVVLAGNPAKTVKCGVKRI